MQSAARRPINLSRSRRQQPNGFAKPRVRPVRHHVSIALAAHRPRRRGEPPRFLCDCCLWHRRCTEALPPLQQRPDDARCFVRLCHRGNTGRAAREYSSKPSRAGRWLRPDVTEDRCRAEHQKARRYRSPPFEMPDCRCFPPLLFCLGTRPSQAAKCRADWKFGGSVTIATIADAVMGPTPGIVLSLLLTSLSLCQSRIFDVWLHVGGWHEAHLVTECPDLAGPVVCGTARLNAYQTRWQTREEGDHLSA